MKALKYIIAGIVISLAGHLHAQVAVNVNIGTPPPWGPAGYSQVRYYYLPDIESYYDVHSSRFIYYKRGVWVQRTTLPLRYRSYDLYQGYKVVLADYKENTPYQHFKEHKSKYSKGYHGPVQKTIGAKPERGKFKEKNLKKEQSEKRIAGDQEKKLNKSNKKSMKKNETQGSGKGKKKK